MSLPGAHFTVTLTIKGQLCGCPGEQQPDPRLGVGEGSGLVGGGEATSCSLFPS